MRCSWHLPLRGLANVRQVAQNARYVPGRGFPARMGRTHHGMNVSRFEPFGALHLLSISGLALTIGALCVTGWRLRGTRAGRLFELTVASCFAALWLAYAGYDAWTGRFDVRYSLPFEFCDLSAAVAALSFARPARTPDSLAWFWGIGLGTQAVFTPDLYGGPGTLAFWAFWAYHVALVGAGVYAVTVRRFRPRWPDLRLAAGLGVSWAVLMFTIDAAFGLNYGYFGRSDPGQPTLLDFLGPWPWRCLLMVMLGVAAMTLLWLPWRALSSTKAP